MNWIYLVCLTKTIAFFARNFFAIMLHTRTIISRREQIIYSQSIDINYDHVIFFKLTHR